MDPSRLNTLGTMGPGTFPARIPLVLACLLAAACGEPGETRVVHAQTAGAAGSPTVPPVDRTEDPRVGTVEAGLLLRTLDGEKRVLMVAAHPDDEDTAVLATLARGLGARTAYLSLSRGEGGQNVIGGELGEGLGLVRTGELLSARSVDGAGQFFTRAFDFGYSKSAEETFQHWPEEELLADVVWVLRTFRPHVVLSVFSGTPRDGHGQHQAAGIVTRAAFDAAGDPARFPDQLEGEVEPWAPDKLYQLVRWSPESATLTFPLGTLDPLLGRSHFQVAMESRSRHRSQYFGAPRVPGPRQGGAELIATRVSTPPGGDDGIFAGVDTTLVGLVASAGLPADHALARELEEYRSGIRAAQESLHAAHPERSTPHLVRALARAEEALALARKAPEGPGRTELLRVLASRRKGVGQALLATSLTVVDVRVDRTTLAPGEEARVEVLVWNGGHHPVQVRGLEFSLPTGWSMEGRRLRTEDGRDENPIRAYFAPDPGTLAPSLPSADRPASVPSGELRRWTFGVAAPPDAAPSQPYFLREERDGSLYRWPEDRTLWARPLDPPLISATVTLDVAESGPFPVIRGATHVGVDGVEGEYRVPFFVVPRVSLEVEPEGMAWPTDAAQGRELTVRARNLSETTLQGAVVVTPPRGWQVNFDPQPLELKPGEEGVRSFALFPVASSDGDRTEMVTFHAAFRETQGGAPGQHGTTFALIDYPHLEPVPMIRPARTRVSRFPVRVREGLRVGYVMGSGDEGPRALRDLGVEVELLDDEALRGRELFRFHAIVLGIRAYETRPGLAAANDAILAFARRGGTVVVQYHRWEYPDGGFAPYPLAIRRPHDRVTDPDARVTFLEPDHPLLRGPNRIEAEDFRGWVQERGLYYLSSWDDRYTPLLEMADPGEEPTRGGLVVARVGDGAYVYTGLALFRQLPAGVPGAYRLLANLVSLRGADLGPGWREDP